MVDMNVANIVACTESEGIGKRFVIWTQGCHFRCPGCCNPHLFSEKGGKIISVDNLMAQLSEAKDKYGIEGATIVGGEPLDQTDSVAAFSRGCQQKGLSVMLFTGFLLEDLKKIILQYYLAWMS